MNNLTHGNYTSSPILHRVTFLPTASTFPEHSRPRNRGGGYEPLRWRVSILLSAVAATLIRTSSSPNCGSSTSCSCSTSGPPGVVITTAFICGGGGGGGGWLFDGGRRKKTDAFNRLNSSQRPSVAVSLAGRGRLPDLRSRRWPIYWLTSN